MTMSKLQQKNPFVPRIVQLYSLAILLVLVQSCSALEILRSKVPKPEFSIQGLRIQEITLSEMTLELLSTVKNPYETNLPSSQLGLNVLLEGKQFTRIDTDLGGIASRSTKRIPIDLKFRYSDLLPFFKMVPSKDSIRLSLSGTLKVPLPAKEQTLLGMKEIAFPVEIERALPSFYPEIEVSGFSVTLPDARSLATEAARRAGFLGSSSASEESSLVLANFDLRFRNRNPASILLSKLKFSMNLDGNSFVDLSPQEILSQGTTNTIPVRAKIPFPSSALLQSLQRKQARFQIEGSSGIRFPGVDENTTEFLFSQGGTLRWQ